MFQSIFANIILEHFYPAGAWLGELTSMDHMVEANQINLSQVGADPDVVKNNATWPLTPAQRTDAGIVIPLATFDTNPTHVTNVEELETNYNKCHSVARQHINALRAAATRSAAYNIAPASNTANTPVLETTGEVKADGSKAMTYNDLLRMMAAFNKADFPQEDRVLLLCPDHQADLLAEDSNRFNQIMANGTMPGFARVFMTTALPTYSSELTKNEFGSTTGRAASLVFQKGEVMRCMGDITGEPEQRWADYRGWLLGFQMRFVAMPFRNKGIGAIVSGE